MGYARNSYIGCHGDAIVHTHEAYGTVRGFFGGGSNHRGTYSGAKPIYNDTGSLIDGTSNTIALSEVAMSDRDGDNRVKSGTAIDFGSNNANPISAAANVGTDVLNNIADCKAKVDSGDRTLLTGTVMITFGRGASYADGRPGVAFFQTVLPPNSPSCRTTGGANNPGQGHGIASASSYHPGGLNVAMGDGSCHFISETVDCCNQTYGSASTDKEPMYGASPFGVWGALGSINGGEAASVR